MKSAFLSLTAVTVFTIFALRSVGEAKPPAPGHIVKKGALPTYCTEADFAAGASAYGPNYGYYYSTKSKSWVSTAWCLPKWGFLASTPSQYVGAGQKVTVTAQAEGGSNNTQYAPETNTISWSVAGKVASGCTSSDISCTFVPFKKRTKEWQWASVEVSMPRTFFVDYPSEFCAGQHLCAGVTTHAWSFVGVPPCGESLPSTVNVTMKNKQFSPSTIRVEPGANVVMCNEDPFPQFPYSPDKKDFGHKRIEQGKCITFKISKKSISSRATYTIYDERHIKMKLTIIELPNNC